MQSFNLSDIAHHLSLSVSQDAEISGFAIDSRHVEPGNFFIAIKGKKVDGANFLKEAASKGAKAVLIDENYSGELFGLIPLFVNDVVGSLQRLAEQILAKRETRVIAITGSLGKTTTKEFTAALLAAQFPVAKSPRSFNSQITLPQTILNADPGAQFIILEMGISEPGNMDRLVRAAPPDMAAITTVALQHATQFPGGLSQIAFEKSKIFSHTKTAIGLVNRDNTTFDVQMASGSCRKITFSMHQRADYVLEMVDGRVRIHTPATSFDVTLNLPLKTHYQNFLVAAAIACEAGVDPLLIQKVAPTLRLPPMRYEIIKKRGITFINDAYNANPDAMRAALHSLVEYQPRGKKIAVLTEMNDLGIFSEDAHRQVAEHAVNDTDCTFLLGQQWIPFLSMWEVRGKECHHFFALSDLITSLKALLNEEDLVLLKGARAYALESVLEHF